MTAKLPTSHGRASPTAATGATGVASEWPKYCAPCKRWLINEPSWAGHLAGKQHKKKVAPKGWKARTCATCVRTREFTDKETYKAHRESKEHGETLVAMTLLIKCTGCTPVKMAASSWGKHECARKGTREGRIVCH